MTIPPILQVERHADRIVVRAWGVTVLLIADNRPHPPPGRAPVRELDGPIERLGEHLDERTARPGWARWLYTRD